MFIFFLIIIAFAGQIVESTENLFNNQYFYYTGIAIELLFLALNYDIIASWLSPEESLPEVRVLVDRSRRVCCVNCAR